MTETERAEALRIMLKDRAEVLVMAREWPGVTLEERRVLRHAEADVRYVMGLDEAEGVPGPAGRT